MTSQTATSHREMVVTDQHIASDVCRLVLDTGGSAIDAAVAIGYALAVVDPCCGNLGGGGFMTIHLRDGRDTFINFRERARLKDTTTLFQDANGNVIPGLSPFSYLAVGIPGSVAGLEKARGVRHGLAPRPDRPRRPRLHPRRRRHQRAGRRDRGVRAAAERRGDLPQPRPALQGGRPPRSARPGINPAHDRVRGRQTPSTKGPIADALVAASNANGGILSKAGFEQYTAEELAPVQCTCRGYKVLSPPILLKGGKVFMVAGAPGGPRIPTEVLGVIQNVIDDGMDIGSAVAAPRIHHQYLPDTVYLEPNALSSSAFTALQGEGYSLTRQTTTWGWRKRSSSIRHPA